MQRINQFAAFAIAALLTASVQAQPPAATPAPPWLAEQLAGLLRAAVPMQYEKKTDWGRTKRITTGIDVDGKLRSLRIRRRKREVRHGVWKWLRAGAINPDETLVVQVENLRGLGPGRAACTLRLRADLDLWGRVRHYNRGVHLGTLTLSGRTNLVARFDCEVGFAFAPGAGLPAVQIEPRVTDSQIKLEGFHLDRVGELGGDFAEEFGRGLRKLIESRLDGEKLTAKMNRSIAKRKEKLRIDPGALLAGPPPTPDD